MASPALVSCRILRGIVQLTIAGTVALSSLGLLWGQAQAVNARLNGTVVDAQDAPIPDVVVTIANANTGYSRQFRTDNSGQYTFTLIPPGTYELRAEKTGFNTALRSGITLSVGQTSSLDIRMEVGQVTQTVEVVASAPLLNTGNANIGSEVTTKQVVEL